MKWVVLLKGINVGGNHLLPMKGLVNTCESLGFSEVRTYIQSGNVVLCSEISEAGLVSSLQRGIERDFGFTVPVIARTAAEWLALSESHPFSPQDGGIHVGCLSGTPRGALDPSLFPGDQALVRGREVFLCFAQGTAKTKLTNDHIERRLGVSVTIRNWNTVQKLREWVS